eukprot:5915899-Prymnesium_polylepis.1
MRTRELYYVTTNYVVHDTASQSARERPDRSLEKVTDSSAQRAASPCTPQTRVYTGSALVACSSVT